MIGVGTFKITEKSRKYVNEVLNSERLSYGYFTQKFERLFAAAHDCRFAVMTNSGTSSLQIALAALKNRYGWKDGDEVIVPAVTFIATSNVVLQNGMKPVFVDVDPVYYELNPDLIEAAITPRTRCIIPVHLFGHPCDMERIGAIAKKHNLRMIEDSCETMFTKLNGKSVGAMSDVGCFSTYVAHILTTGVGGLCTTNDPDLAVQLRSLMNHGRDSIYISIDDDKNKSKEEMELIIQRRFSFVQMGYSYRVTEMEGALGLAEFEDHEQMMRKRWDNAQYFLQKLRPLEKHIQLPALREGAGHAFMMFPIVVRKDQKRGLVSYLESHGIETRDMLPLINQPFYKELLGVREEDFPVAKWVNESGFYFGCHQNITEIEREYIVDVFHSYFAQESVAQEKAALIVMSKGDGRAAQMMLDALPVASFQDLVFVEGGNDRADEEACTAFAKRGFRVVRGTPGRSEGKGELLRRAVATTECENVVVFGGDGADSPEDIPRLLIRLKQGHALVIASRFMPGGARESEKNALYRSVGNRFFSFLLSVLFNANVSDCNNLFRGFKKTAISKLNLHEGGENAMFEMTVKALQNGNQFSECPTLERKAIQARRRRNRVLSALSFARILFQHSGGRNRALPTGGNKQLPGATGPHK